MNYLDLVNAVLVRLREDTVTTTTFQSDPFYKMIGATVNDAKRTVEDAWQWSQLRGIDSIPIAPNQRVLELPDSYDNIYEINAVKNVDKGNFLRWAPEAYFAIRDQGTTGNPGYYGFYLDNESTLNKQMQIWPASAEGTTIDIYRARHQGELVEWDDVLKVPSRPVFHLATALASRERGEIGGAPVSELFGLADKALSDAIAYDSARFPEELVWWSVDNPAETNVRNY